MDPLSLGTSPTTVARSPLYDLKTDKSRELDLAGFLEEVPNVVRERKDLSLVAGSAEDPIHSLFERVRLEPHDWEAYAHFDSDRHYTRNLISTDHKTYTLLLLCWNPNQESPIHDHPCDGCWMRVLQGEIFECRYKQAADKLECVQESAFEEGAIAFIKDSLGFHKVGNPGTKPSVTMHLYSPPFQTCRFWLDESRKPSKSCICHYSEYGEILE